jgi:hypothetical protein
MRRITRPWILAAAIVMGTPAAARAQFRAGGREVPAADPTRASSTAARAPVVLDRVALLLDHARDLGLSPAQAKRLRAVEDSLQSLNLPLLGQLDTLRGPDGTLLPGDVAPADSGVPARRARQQAIANVLASLHDNELGAHMRALALLDLAQRMRAAGIEATAQKAFDKARSSRVRGGGWQSPRSTNNPNEPGSVVQPPTSWPR